jgi:broad specificity phosphatase PhoE
MTRLILIRHGETEWNLQERAMGHLDSPLSSLGQFQAQRLAERCTKTHFDALYSSDLGRAAATAQAIADRSVREITFDSRLRERAMGIFQGLTTPEMEAQFPNERAAYSKAGAAYVIPSGESANQTIERALLCIEEIAGRHVGQTVLIVTHGGVLMGLFESVLGLPFGSARRYRRLNAAWNVFSRDSDRWVLETWGDVTHLMGNEEVSACG